MRHPSTLEEIEFLSNSFVDPSGRLFRWNGRLLRGIFPARTELIRRLLSEVQKSDSTMGNHLVETKICQDFELEGFSLILEHREIQPVSYPHEWAPELLKRGALRLLEIADWALEIGLSMADASPWNLIPDPVEPRFVDLGSFRPVEEEGPLLWAAYGQFCTFFLYPLYLYSAGFDHLVRDRLRDFQKGVDIETCSRLLPSSKRFWPGQVAARLEAPRLFGKAVSKLKLEERLKAVPNRMNPHQLHANRKRFLRGLTRDVEKIRLPIPVTEWSDYDQGCPDFEKAASWTPKQQSVQAVLQKTQPHSVLDVACNQGWFAILAGKTAQKVIAFDADPASVAKLTHRVLKEGHNVLPLCMDLLNPTPASGWKLKQFSSALDRFPCDLVMALALIHHLVLSQMQDFPRVVELLKAFSKRWVLIDFVPLDDPRSQQILADYRREEFGWYTEDNFLKVLNGQFSSVEKHPSWPEGRSLYLCEL